MATATTKTVTAPAKATQDDERIYFASQWTLMRRKFLKHRLAVVAMFVLIAFYLVALFCEFVAPQDPNERNSGFIEARPQALHFFHEGRFYLRPFVYPLEKTVDLETMERVYTENKEERLPIYFFVRGDEYELWGLFPSDRHLFGLQSDEPFFLFGSDKLGRDLLSRTIYGARISLSVGLVGVALSFVLGATLGGISGYFGGTADTVIQRTIEFLLAIPTIPIWMALAAALPPGWDPVKLYFGMTVILSLVGWTQIARVTRGQVMSLRQEDFVTAAIVSGATSRNLIIRHLLPGCLSYLIVSLTLAVPQMILAETALSFLGLGLQPPAISWGVLLQDAQAIRSVALQPWLLIPGLFTLLAVLAFNFVGDGLRDSADPYA